MSKETPVSDFISPPADVPEIHRGDWSPLSAPDLLVEHLTTHHWNRSEPPASWNVAQLSHAAYVYRETLTGWAVVAKFYAVKTGERAERYADHEFACTQRARKAGLAKGDARAVRPLAAWRGVLLLEYVDGLTLEDTIAVRRSRPGTLLPSLKRAARLLATLHTHGAQPDASPDFRSPAVYARKVTGELARWGVLQNDPIVHAGLLRLIDRWEAHPAMSQFTPTLIHGDATTSNFILPENGGIVAVDWERLYITDPAADLGRLMAEVSHSIKQHGGTIAEAVPLVQWLADAYCQASTVLGDPEALLTRARFYQASSILRIARNGWVSRLDRTALVAQALVLLNR